MKQNRYLDLLEWLESQAPVTPAGFFTRLKKGYGIDYAVYIDVLRGQEELHVRQIHHNLDERQIAGVTDLGQSLLSAVLAAAIDAVKTLDFEELAVLEPHARSLVLRAHELAIADQGLTLPLPARAGHSALLAIGFSRPVPHWTAFRQSHEIDLQALAGTFHSHLSEHKGRRMAALSEREQQVLTWSAAGKSDWEIATILGISERSVRTSMSGARRKLDAASDPQAVARALREGLITAL